MVHSGQTRSSILSRPFPPESSPQKAEFPISRFNVKNGVSSDYFPNPLPPMKEKKVPSTQTSIIQKNNFDTNINSFICTQLTGFKYCYLTWIVLFAYS